MHHTTVDIHHGIALHDNTRPAYFVIKQGHWSPESNRPWCMAWYDVVVRGLYSRRDNRFIPTDNCAYKKVSLTLRIQVKLICIYELGFLTRQAVNTGRQEIDINGCYSLVKIAFAPLCACKNNGGIWRHNASTPRSPDLRDPLWGRRNAKSERTVLGYNGEISYR